MHTQCLVWETDENSGAICALRLITILVQPLYDFSRAHVQIHGCQRTWKRSQWLEKHVPSTTCTDDGRAKRKLQVKHDSNKLFFPLESFKIFAISVSRNPSWFCISSYRHSGANDAVSEPIYTFLRLYSSTHIGGIKFTFNVFIFHLPSFLGIHE